MPARRSLASRAYGAVPPRYELLLAFVRRELGVRYKEAHVSMAWAVIQPLAYMPVFTLLFARVAKVSGSGPLVAYVALVPWTFASTSIAQGGQGALNQLRGRTSSAHPPSGLSPAQ